MLCLQVLDYQMKQAHKLADMYREQVIQLEDELARIREEGEVGQEMFKVSQLFNWLIDWLILFIDWKMYSTIIKMYLF